MATRQSSRISQGMNKDKGMAKDGKISSKKMKPVEVKEKRKYTKRVSRTIPVTVTTSSAAASIKKKLQNESQDNDEKKTLGANDSNIVTLQSESTINKLRSAAVPSPTASQSVLVNSFPVDESTLPIIPAENSLPSNVMKKLEEQERVTNHLKTQVDFLQNTLAQQTQVARATMCPSNCYQHDVMRVSNVNSAFFNQQPLRTFLPFPALADSNGIPPSGLRYLNHGIQPFVDPREIIYSPLEHFPINPFFPFFPPL